MRKARRSRAAAALTLAACACAAAYALALALGLLPPPAPARRLQIAGALKPAARALLLREGGAAAGSLWVRAVRPLTRPGTHVVVCVPAKVSSTSFWSSVFWAYTARGEQFSPCRRNSWVHAVDGCGWERFVESPSPAVSSVAQLAELEREDGPGGLYAFAIARDPIKRIISAYKSKAACDEQRFGTDRAGRRKIVRQLLRSAGRRGDARQCVRSFAEFCELVHAVFSSPDVWLDPHFAPQNAKCRYDLVNYAEVVRLEELDEARMAGLSRALGTPVPVRPFHSHGSGAGVAPGAPPADLEEVAAASLRLLYEVFADDMRADTLGALYPREWGADLALVMDILAMAP